MAEPRIRKLNETVANQIAAGEVVERPASVVKECVENALDAGATRIDIEIEGGGAKRITIADNGCGMSPEDVSNALERQATSKISTTEDIVKIATFGFRGEAVPSIASVSRFQITSRSLDADAATRIHVNGGIAEPPVVTGHPVGTTVEVRDLFFNLPARRKFLRAPATEQTRIRQALTSIALANPEVAFRFRADGRELFRLPAEDSIDDRIRALLGDALADAMLTIDTQVGAIHVYGRMTRLDFVRIGTPETFVFINRRPATAPQLQYALREAFPKEHRPTVLLFIDLPPEEVDVNVHPAKREVRFRQGNKVVDAVLKALHEAQHGSITDVPPAVAPPPSLLPIGALPIPQAPRPLQQTLPLPPRSQSPAPPSSVPPPPSSASSVTPELPPLPEGAFPPGLSTPAPTVTAPWRWFRLAELLEHGYWLLVTDQGYVTVDAKAALERVTYERLVATTETLAQPLLLPETLSLSASDAERVRRFMPELQQCGFGIADFGKDTFLIDALPAFLDAQEPLKLIPQIAHELDATGVKKGVDAWRREVVARASAQAVCGLSPITTPAAAEELLRRLGACAMPYVTPRGRPTMFLTSYRELDRRFRRG